jgi:adenosine kinase
VRALVVTLGGDGSQIHADGQVHDIPPAKASEVVDPTGCGDAYRAGLMTGIHKGMDWPTCGRLAGLLGAIKIARRGGQNHRFTWDEIADRFKSEYGYAL